MSCATSGNEMSATNQAFTPNQKCSTLVQASESMPPAALGRVQPETRSAQLQHSHSVLTWMNEEALFTNSHKRSKPKLALRTQKLAAGHRLDQTAVYSLSPTHPFKVSPECKSQTSTSHLVVAILCARQWNANFPLMPLWNPPISLTEEALTQGV